MQNLLSTYNPFRQKLIAVEYTVKEATPVFFGLKFAKKKEEWDIDQTFTAFEIGELSEFLKETKQVHLAITDDQVLCKEVSQTDVDAVIISEAFPNLNLDDFYYQILRTSHKSFVTVCRKEYVASIITKLQTEGIKVLSVTLGGLKVSVLSKFTDHTLQTSTLEIKFDTNEIDSIVSTDNTQEQYKIEGLTFSSTHTLPLAMGLYIAMGYHNISGNLDLKNQALAQGNKEKQLFKNVLQIGTGFLLITLLINFFVFNSFYKKWQNLQEELQIYTSQKEQIIQKQSLVNNKELLVQSILTTGFSKSSYYINQIIQSQPSTIVLSSLVYQPLLKPVRNKKEIEFKDKVITITGTSINKSDFTIWLRAIEALSYIDTVTIVHYGLNKRNTSDFELMLKMKSNETKK